MTVDSIKKVVLVVDDEPMIVRALKRILRDDDVHVALSGRQATRLLESGLNPDLILCDLMMPEITGMALFEWLQTARPGLEQRIVFMTGGAFDPAAQQFLAQIKNRCLAKPFVASDVLELTRVLPSSDGI